MKWMATDAADNADLAAYQAEVLRGLDAQRVRDLADMEAAVKGAAGTHVSTIWNMRKFRHESRFKRFYDDPTKFELSGPDGGPVQVDVVAKMSDAELRRLALGEGGGEDE